MWIILERNRIYSANCRKRYKQKNIETERVRHDEGFIRNTDISTLPCFDRYICPRKVLIF